MSKRWVKAFTIMEVTIAMMITAILIGITYTSYTIINKSYGSFQRKNQEMADLTRLDAWLKKDFTRADLILRDTDGIALNVSGKQIRYRFGAGFIVRDYLRTDTFRFKNDSLLTAFENKPVEQLNDLPEDNRIDEMGFILTYQNQNIPYHYHKVYSAVNLIQRNPNAIH